MTFIDTLIPTLQSLGILFYWFILLVSILEVIPFVGSFLPGAVLVVLAGFLSAQGYYHFRDLIWFAAIGAIIGDSITYWLGTKGTRFFKHENKILKLSHIDKGQAFFKKLFWSSFFLKSFNAPGKESPVTTPAVHVTP